MLSFPSQRLFHPISSFKSQIKMVFRRRVHFFECHSLLGNKWTYISELFHNKSAKQMKNHFYSSIVKTLRKISKNKFDSDMKDTIITYYSLIYLKKLFSNSQFMNMLQSTVNCAVIDSKNVTLKNISSVIT